MLNRILAISESDSSGAAGIQGDVKTVLTLGGFAVTAVSALVAQNIHGVQDVLEVDPDFLGTQIRLALEENRVDGIKIGFLPNAEAVNAVADFLDGMKDGKPPVVVDPSIVSRSGEILVDEEAIAAWKRRLYIHASVLTPNLKEAEILGTMAIHSRDDVREASSMMRTLGVENVILKASGLEAGKEIYFLATGNGEHIYERPTLEGKRTMGAGGMLSSALAVFLGRGLDVAESARNAIEYLNQAIENSHIESSHDADGINGAINHAFNAKSLW